MMAEITNSELGELLYFSLKESIEFAKTSTKDYVLAVEGRLTGNEIVRKYQLSEKISSIMRPVCWYLSDNGLIPSNAGNWNITEKARNLEDNELKKIAESLIKKWEIYLRSNFNQP
jgi:hypothetical protein